MATGRKSLLDGILYFVNTIFALALLCAYLAYYIPPHILTFFSFMALAYPVLAFVNILFVFYWAIKLKRKIVLSLLCLAIGYMHLGRLYNFGNPQRMVRDSESLKVMSFNVRMFNQYHWLKENDIPKKIHELLKNENPDVLLLQEYYEKGDHPLADLHYPYQHAKLTHDGRNYGLMILSRFPITGSQLIDIKGDTSLNHQFEIADIRWKGKTIRFVNVQLASVGLESKDYELLENPGQEDQQKIKTGIKSIAISLNRAFKRRERQTETLSKIISDSSYPLVLAGDFNDVPQSYAYHQVNLELEDSFEKAGSGFGKTYVKSPVPLRIDFIFHSDSLNAFNFKVIDQELSDHYPVETELEWR